MRFNILVLATLLMVLTSNTYLYAAHLNVGYGNSALTQYSKKDTMISMNLWVSEIIKNGNHTSSFKFYDDIEKMADDFHSNKLDFVVSYGLDFVKYFDKSYLTTGVSGGSIDREIENLVLVTQKDTNLSKLKSLKNPIIALKKGEELAMVYAKYLSLKGNYRNKISFLETTKRSSTLLKVFFNKADLAITTQKAFDFAKELNPQIGKKLKVLRKTDLSASSFGFFHKKLDPEMKEFAFNTSLNLNKYERGKQILTLFKAETVNKIEVDDLLPIEKFYKEYLNLKKKKK